MMVKLECTWRDALRSTFKPDVVRKSAVRFRRKKLTCVVHTQLDHIVYDLKQWFDDNKVTTYNMFGLYLITPNDGKVFYDGLVFDFIDENNYMLFKLCFN